LNHYALGAVCGFLFRRLAGIAPLEPGFRRIEVRPLIDVGDAHIPPASVKKINDITTRLGDAITKKTP